VCLASTHDKAYLLQLRARELGLKKILAPLSAIDYNYFLTSNVEENSPQAKKRTLTIFKGEEKMRNVILICLLLSIPCYAETIIVDQNGFADFDNIQDAIDSSWHNDKIIVRPGIYNENISFSGANILLTSEDPNDSNTVNSTVITGDVSSGGVSFQLAQTSTLRGFRLDGASITCYGASPIITKNIIENCIAPTGVREGGAIRGYTDSSPEITYNIIRNNKVNLGSSGTVGGGAIANCHGLIAHNVIEGNYARVVSSATNSNACGGGLYKCSGKIVNNAIIGNVCDSLKNALGAGLYNCNGIVVNNIIAFNNSYYVGDFDDGGGIYGQCQNSYNCFWQNKPNDLAGGAVVGTGDFNGDPRFAREYVHWYPGGQWVSGDCHLKSQAGRWDPNLLQWVNDTMTSFCIDVGDPCEPIGVEPNPNGGRINIGVYGGTAEASKSPSGIVEPVCSEQLEGDTNNDCKVDFLDFVKMANNWLKCNLDPPSACWE